MTEAFDPNALVDAKNLLAIMPEQIPQRHDPETAAVGFVGLARQIMNRAIAEVPLGELRDDPTNHWGLAPEEKGWANREAESYLTESRFAVEAKALAAEVFPEDTTLQTETVRNATLILHHAAQNTILLPRRQVYEAFTRMRRERLTSTLGVMAASHILYASNPQVKGRIYANAALTIRGIRPIAEIPELSELGPTAARSILQEMIGDAGNLARLLLRYDPERLTEQGVWPSGPTALAQSVLRRDPLDLRQALLDAPDTPAREIIADYLRNPSHLDELVANATGKRTAYTIKYSREQDERNTRITQRQLDEQLDRDEVHPELLTAAEGEVIQLTPENEVLSQGTLSKILNANQDVFAYSQSLDSIAEREAERTGMPELSKTWQDNASNPVNKLLGDYYGRVGNLRIVKLPVDESVLDTKGETTEQIDLRRLVRMHVIADIRSSAGSPITRTVEVLVYPRRVHGRGRRRDLITCETRDLENRELSGANAVQRLWAASAARAIDLDQKRSLSHPDDDISPEAFLAITEAPDFED